MSTPNPEKLNVEQFLENIDRLRNALFRGGCEDIFPYLLISNEKQASASIVKGVNAEIGSDFADKITKYFSTGGFVNTIKK